MKLKREKLKPPYIPEEWPDEKAQIKAAITETMEEIEYWHSDMLTDEARRHPRGSGWARVYDKLKAAMEEL
jgi:hypothetical protein